jgi:hypothetical protein
MTELADPAVRMVENLFLSIIERLGWSLAWIGVEG